VEVLKGFHRRDAEGAEVIIFLVLREFLCVLCVSAMNYFLLLVPNLWTLSRGLEFEGIYLGCKKS